MPRKGSRKYSDSELKQEARKYQHRSDFNKGSYIKYAAALRYGILEEVCSHMTPKFKGSQRWDRRYLYIATSGNKVYVGLTINPDARFKKHHVIDNLPDASVKVSKRNYPVQIAANAERRWIEYLRRQKGTKVINRKKGGGLGNFQRVTSKKLRKAAYSCKTWKEFREQHPKFYAIAKARGIKQEIADCINAGKGHKVRDYSKRSLKRSVLLASRCETLAEFRSKYPLDYQFLNHTSQIKAARNALDEGKGCAKARKFEAEKQDIEAKVAKCNTWSEFIKKYPAEYVKVKNRKWLAEFKTIAAPVAA